MRRTVTAFVAILLAVAPAAAQDKIPIAFNVGAGWILPSTEVKKSFNTGWNGSLGGTFKITEHLGIQAEYIYAKMNGPDKVLGVTATPASATTTSVVVRSNHQMHVGTFDVIYRAQNSDLPVGGYVLAGGGIYHRVVQLTSDATGYATVCDPNWYLCEPTPVAIERVVGDRSSNDFGINFGAGVSFGSQAKVYIETRYHYVWGRDFTPAGSQGTTACGGGCTSNAAYFPVTLGVRW